MKFNWGTHFPKGCIAERSRRHPRSKKQRILGHTDKLQKSLFTKITEAGKKEGIIEKVVLTGIRNHFVYIPVWSVKIRNHICLSCVVLLAH